MKYIVTNHAKNRAKQRLRLYMMSHEQKNISKFLEEQIKFSDVSSKWSHPYYKKKLEKKHGKNTFIRSTKVITFCCVRKNENEVIIKTVYKNERHSLNQNSKTEDFLC